MGRRKRKGEKAHSSRPIHMTKLRWGGGRAAREGARSQGLHLLITEVKVHWGALGWNFQQEKLQNQEGLGAAIKQSKKVNHEKEALNPAEKGRKCNVTAEVLKAPKTSLNILASFTTSDITHVFLYVASAEGLMRENNSLYGIP